MNYNKEVFPSSYKEWTQMHMCMRCGHEFRLSEEEGTSGTATHQNIRAALDKIEGISQSETQLVESLRWQKFSHGTVEYKLLEGVVADTSWSTGQCAALVRWCTPEFPDEILYFAAETGKKVILFYAIAKNDGGKEAVEKIWLLNINKGDFHYFENILLEGGENHLTLKQEKPMNYPSISIIANLDGYNRVGLKNRILLYGTQILFAIVGYFLGGFWGAVGGLFIGRPTFGYFIGKFYRGDAVVRHIEKITKNFQAAQS